MYCKLFASLYQGTLRGKSDEILVFTNLLAHCDASGHVDKHFRAIAEETGLEIDRVKSALLVLEAPDEESRSPEADGARIQRVDEHRAWGWVIVNYGKYRAIKNEEDRREQNRLAQERFRNKNKTKSSEVITSKQRNPSSAQEEAEGEEKEKKKPQVAVVLPFDSEEFATAWNLWLDHKKEIKQKMPITTIKPQLADCAKWGESKAITAINLAIKNNWRGLFEPKDSDLPKPTHRPTNETFTLKNNGTSKHRDPWA